MSKAFLPSDGRVDEVDEYEDGDGLDDSDSIAAGEAQSLAKLGLAGKAALNYISPSGFARLKSEVHQLLNIERPRVVETVAWAAANGDRSENADYTYGKKRLREIDRRLRFLQARLDRAQVVDPSQQAQPDPKQVRFGATVRIMVTAPNGEESERTYRIGGIDEINVRRGVISWRSPVGLSLLQTRVGDVVTVQTPRGEDEIEVIEVRYESWPEES